MLKISEFSRKESVPFRLVPILPDVSSSTPRDAGKGEPMGASAPPAFLWGSWRSNNAPFEMQQLVFQMLTC